MLVVLLLKLLISFFFIICVHIVSQRNRTIIWNPNLGKVEMDIVINYKCLSVIVSPIQATVIWNFQNQGTQFYMNLSYI